jgi:hypothetical protein
VIIELIFCRELWWGPRSGVDGARKVFGVDEVYTFHMLGDKIKDILGKPQVVFFDDSIDQEITGIISRASIQL